MSLKTRPEKLLKVVGTCFGHEKKRGDVLCVAKGLICTEVGNFLKMRAAAP